MLARFVEVSKNEKRISVSTLHYVRTGIVFSEESEWEKCDK
jgi:hypothetical protein